jgi:hypothetical protein
MNKNWYIWNWKSNPNAAGAVEVLALWAKGSIEGEPGIWTALGAQACF